MQSCLMVTPLRYLEQQLFVRFYQPKEVQC